MARRANKKVTRAKGQATAKAKADPGQQLEAEHCVRHNFLKSRAKGRATARLKLSEVLLHQRSRRLLLHQRERGHAFTRSVLMWVCVDLCCVVLDSAGSKRVLCVVNVSHVDLCC